jgi:hypothetical protein
MVSQAAGVASFCLPGRPSRMGKADWGSHRGLSISERKGLCLRR